MKRISFCRNVVLVFLEFSVLRGKIIKIGKSFLKPKVYSILKRDVEVEGIQGFA